MYYYWVQVVNPPPGWLSNLVDSIAAVFIEDPTKWPFPPLPGSSGGDVACGGYDESLQAAMQSYMSLEYGGGPSTSFNISFSIPNEPASWAGTVHSPFLVTIWTDDQAEVDTIRFDPWKGSAPTQTISGSLTSQ